MVLHHNHLRDAFVGFCHQAHLSVKVEGGSGLTPDMSHSWPADVLVRDWAQGKPAAFDITVTSPLSPAILAETSQRVGAASLPNMSFITLALLHEESKARCVAK